ncbi:hypothetical protein [Actinomadura sp. WMMA1423]|uniref:hypothetical protein n=1 Tax=Actinomadura sp. WMMA1423 TaxID=2591108 RepID=UPI0011462672|nr:hypothetical protein [Actinomadura sp. WMMA1423]
MTRRRRPTLAATDTHTCLKCGRPLHASKEWFVGDHCAQILGPARVEALRIYAEQQVDPFTLPTGQKPPSHEARLNNRNARAAASGQMQLCRHYNQVGRCGTCRWESKAENASKRILREICAEPLDRRRTERAAVQNSRAAARRHPYRTPPRPSPVAAPAPRPAEPAPAPGPVQTALL